MLREMEPICKARAAETALALEAAQKQLENEVAVSRDEEQKLKQVLTWAERFDKANIETQHMILSALIEKIEVGRGYKMTIHYKLTAEQFLHAEGIDISAISA